MPSDCASRIPEVTVLLPVYNCERDVAAAIRSILDQTLREFELLVIDDGSTDKTTAIIESIKDPRLRLERNGRNLGLVGTLNRGLALIKSPYIARMDADDIALPERLELQLKEFKSRPDLVLLGTSADVIDENGGPLRNDLDAHRGSDFLRWKILTGTICYHPTVMIRRSLLDGLAYNKQHLHVEDYGLWMELMERGEIDNLEHRLLKYRRHGSQVGAKHKTAQVENSALILRNYLSRKYGAVFPAKTIRHWVTPQYIRANPADATEFLRLVIWMRPSNKKFRSYLRGNAYWRAWVHYLRRIVLIGGCTIRNLFLSDGPNR